MTKRLLPVDHMPETPYWFVRKQDDMHLHLVSPLGHWEAQIVGFGPDSGCAELLQHGNSNSSGNRPEENEEVHTDRIHLCLSDVGYVIGLLREMQAMVARARAGKKAGLPCSHPFRVGRYVDGKYSTAECQACGECGNVDA